jgi:hypothetical protein
MLIIKCRKSDVSIIENDVFDVAIWFSSRFEKISRRVVEIWDVINLMFSFFDDSRQDFIMIFNSFDLFKCSDIISIESNDFQHNADFYAIKFEIMIDSNIVNVVRLAAGLNFGHVEQFDPIQISNRTWLFVRRIESSLICCSTFEPDPYRLFETLD